MRIAPFLVFCLLALPMVFPVKAVWAAGHIDIPIGRSWPRSIAINPQTHQVFVTAVSGFYPPTGFSFAILNSTSNAITSVIPFAGIPGEMAVDEKTNTVFVVSESSVIVMDGTKGQMIGSFAVNVPIYAIAYDQDSRVLYVTDADSLISIDVNSIDVNRSAVSGLLKVGMYPESITFDHAKRLIYVANYGSSSISVVDGRTFTLLRTIGLPPYTNPSSLTFAPQLNRLFVSTGRNNILAVDGDSGSVVASIRIASTSADSSTYYVTFDPVTNYVFVATPPSTLLTLVDARSYQVVTTVALDYAPYEMVADRVTGNVYVTNYHQVSVIGTTYLSPASGFMLLTLAALAASVLLSVLYLYRKRVTSRHAES